MTVLKNIFLDQEGLHKSKPVACKVTGILTIKIDGKAVRVKQCNNTKPKSKSYLSIAQKEHVGNMYKRRSRSPKTLVKKNKDFKK